VVSQTYNRDCLEAMREMPDKAFDLAIVDPPYGLPKDSLNGRGQMANRALRMDTDWDSTPSDEYFVELCRVTSNQLICGGNHFTLPPCRGFAVWDKKQPWDSFAACEYVWTSFNVPAKLFAFDNRYSGKIHPTQKPIELYKWLLTNYAKDGDTILDTHLGSGSSRIAAYDLGFDFTGYELDKDYFEAQEQRFANHIAQPKLFVPEQKVEQSTMFEG
jgi:site-specific DNA-methyltransferase (adenine-specific)